MATTAWYEGYDEYTLDPEAINPYDYPSIDYLDWEDGFSASAREHYRNADDRTLDQDWIVDPDYDDE